MKKNILFSLLVVIAVAAFGFFDSNGAQQESLIDRAPETSFHVVSDAASPRVAYALHQKSGHLVLTVDVASYSADGTGVSLQAGLAADKTVVLTDKAARIEHVGNVIHYVFAIPDASLVNSPSGWEKLHLGLAVAWAGGPFGEPRQRENFLQNPQRATHGGLSPRPDDWQPIDLAELARADADARLKIAFDFNQPMDGKATIVIENEKGNRIRNLISGQPMAAGPQRIFWDGADDKGHVMPPGNYTWRAISHPGLSIHYLMSYENAPGSNHSTFESAATNGRDIFFGTAVTEGGVENAELTPDGTLVRGFNAPGGHGLNRNAIAADDKFLYAVYDGISWDQKVDRTKPDWKLDAETRLYRFDLTTGNPVDFSKARSSLLSTYPIGPGSPNKTPDGPALAGLALFNGKLYQADSAANLVREIDPGTGAVGTTFPLQNPVALSASANGLYAIAGGQLVKLDPASGQATTITALEGEPKGLFAAADGRFFVTDNAASAQIVRVYDSAGKPSGTVGQPGGIIPGPYNPLALKNPAGLVLSPDGHLWVTEWQRWTPKRLAAYDVATNTMWKEFFGPTSYGASGASFDPANPSHWIGQGTMFDLDFAAKTVKPLTIMGGQEGMHYRFWRQDGRTFVIAYGKATCIEELKADGTLRPLAFLSDAHQFCYSQNWKPPQAFVDAFNRDYPNEKYVSGAYGRPNHGFGMLWVDKNGDGIMQADEIEFSTAAKSFAGSGWGHDYYDLTLRVPATVGDHSVLVTLKPDGWWPGGAPRYPALNDAVKTALPIDLEPGQNSVETTTDHFGNLLLNTDPVMKAFAPDGHLLWSFPNRWSGVGGSHDAPMPQAGVLQGVLFYTGVAPLDDQGDVTVMNGNHGRLFAMTTDGLYLDEMFHDIRLMVNPQAGGVGVLGGECFGGSFGRSEKDGNYYYQGGGIEYRIYRIDGLKEIKRNQGTFTVGAEQSRAAENNQVHAIAAAVVPKEVTIPYRDTPPTIDGNDNDWPAEPLISWEREPGYKVAIRAAYDTKMLYLFYNVTDSSPWVNNGKDWQSLFKTGDSIDLQLGTDPKANAMRSGPVPGDLRLLVAPFGDKNIAVLYRHRLPGAKDGVVFQSPWRGEKVDSVKQLDSAKIAVWHDNGSYRVELAVPLVDLGLDPAAVAARKLRADFGVIYGDAAGTTDVFRNYWANPSTGLVNDVPGEIMLTPNLWGYLTLEPKKP